MEPRAPALVVFACVYNAGRPQMAAAWFTRMVDPSRARAISAGTRPGGEVHAVVVQAMQEVGVDLSAATPRLLTPALAAGARVLVTMGCGEDCPYIPGAERDDWLLKDPAHLPIEDVRVIREEIRQRVSRLLATRGWSRTEPQPSGDDKREGARG